jgi:protein arginine kinase
MNLSLWSQNSNPIWLATQLRLQRNIEKFNFPQKLPAEKRKQLVSLVSKELLSVPGLTNPQILKADNTSPMEKEFIYEHFLTSNGFVQAHSGEAFVIDDSGRFFATVNLNDHIQFYYLDTEEDIENSCNALERIEVELGKKLKYSYSHRFGFLTADPADCGTALTVSIFLQLPALIHSDELNEFIMEHQDDSILTTGLQGTLDEITGDLLVIRNNYTLGMSEEGILSSVRSYATKLIVHEQGKRKQLEQEDCPVMKDKVSRAYGVLAHSYQIDAKEALNAISLLKLGASLGWMTGVTMEELNALFFGCRRAHLLSLFETDPALEEIPHKRAEYIHSILEKAELHIEE